MSKEHPAFYPEVIPEAEAVPEHEERVEPAPSKRMASSRTLQAIALATSLFAQEPSAEAKKPRHSDASHEQNVTQHEQRRPSHRKRRTRSAHRASSRDVSLDTHQDHGLQKEVQKAEQLGLHRFDTEREIQEALEDGELVDIQPTPGDGYVLSPDFAEVIAKESRHLYASLLPYAAEKLRSIAMEYEKRFHKKLEISSVLRTKKYVDDLREKVKNQNVAKGYTSTHMRGTTIDIKYAQLDEKEEQWLAARLIDLETMGEAQATKEVFQKCFHVMFYPPKQSEVPPGEIIDLDAKDPWGK